MARLARQGLLVAWTVLGLAPFVLIVLLAFRADADVYAYPLGIGGSYRVENFASAWAGPVGTAGMATFLRNSLLALMSALAVNFALGVPGAYFALRLPRRAASGFLGLFVLVSVVPIVLLLIPYYRVFNSLQLLNHPWALGVVYGVLALPTTVLILHAYFAAFPRELVEAAVLDGLGDFGAFCRIVLPLSGRALAAVGLLLAIWVWSETQLAIVLLQDASSQTAAVGVLGFQSFYASQLGALFAGLAIVVLPVIAVYLALSRHFARGVAIR